METALEILRQAGVWGGYVLVAVLCVAGLALSCLSLFGAWVVAGAAGLAAYLSGSDFPGLWTVVVFLLLAGLLEVVEAVAGAWGVQGRGGSKLAGFGALVGGLLGLFFGGALIPIPVLGSLLAMMAGGFLFAYLIEYQRLKRVTHAAHIAWGAVVGRIMVIFLKVMVTLAMIGWLVVGMVLSLVHGGGEG